MLHKEKRLTEREVEILSRLADGKKTREIAHELFISIKTVESHCSNLKIKLELTNLHQLIVFAVRWLDQQECWQIQAQGLNGTVVNYRVKRMAAKDDGHENRKVMGERLSSNLDGS